MTATRIASLLASGTEILFALGLSERVVAISHECDYPPEATNRPRVTRTRVDAAASSGEIDAQVRAMSAAREALYEIDEPLLASLQPDLIVTQAQCDVCAVRFADVLRAVERQPSLRGAQVVPLNPQSLDDIFADILRVGAAAGAEIAARELVDRLQMRVAAVRGRATRGADTPVCQAPTTRTTQARVSTPQSDAYRAMPKEQPRVVALEWLDPLMVSGNWMPELIELAGGLSRLSLPGQHSPSVTWEAIVAENPDVILVMPCGFDLTRTLAEATLLERLPGWHDLSAVRAGRVFAVDGNAYFNRSGPRMVDSLELLAHLFYPGELDRADVPVAPLVSSTTETD